MAIETRVAPRHTWKLSICFIVCLALGAWGAYDWFYGYPKRDVAVARYSALTQEKRTIEEDAKAAPLSEAKIKRFEEVKSELDAVGDDVPQPLSKFDYAVQFWLYIVGCGVLGTLYCVFMLWSLSRRRYRLDDEAGELLHPNGTWRTDDVVAVDMDRWMEKSLATLKHRDGRTLLLDDYKYRNIHLIVGRFAHRFHPSMWTPEAKLIKPDAGDAASEAPEAT